ncbi:hypothetical protein [Azospirillum humicireducens]|uniref:hypothetical protein n=1 Tax=Azospirillum humicireducens TaxID=1226968 RepID=UPI001304A34A|nr:hypothetical protein [Azospirillum humicireducens]
MKPETRHFSRTGNGLKPPHQNASTKPMEVGMARLVSLLMFVGIMSYATLIIS